VILNVARYYAFFSFEWQDEAIEQNLVWNTAHGKIFYQSINDGFFYGHVTPFHLIIAIGYLLVPHVCTWHFLSVFGIALGSIVIYKLACHVLKEQWKAFLIALVYLLYFPLYYIHIGPNDTITFFIPLFLLTFYFFVKGHFRKFIICLILAMTCKESIAVIAVLLSFYALISKKGRKWFIAPFVLGIVWFIISTCLIIPHVSGVEYGSATPPYDFASLDPSTLLGLIKFILFSPMEAFYFMFTNEHITLFLTLLLPLCFLPFLSLTTLIGLPGFLQIFLMNGPLVNQGAYYVANIIPFVFLGYIYGLKNLNTILTRFQNPEKKTKKLIMVDTTVQ